MLVSNRKSGQPDGRVESKMEGVGANQTASVTFWIGGGLLADGLDTLADGGRMFA